MFLCKKLTFLKRVNGGIGSVCVRARMCVMHIQQVSQERIQHKIGRHNFMNYSTGVFKKNQQK